MNRTDALKIIIGVLADELQDELASKTRAIKKNRTLRKKRSVWSRNWLLSCAEGKDWTQFLQCELRIEDEETFRDFNRMSGASFNKLLEIVGPRITKQDTVFREAIPAQAKLLLTLRFLATGDSYASLSLTFRISIPAISKFVPEVLNAISDLRSDYLKLPQTKQEWLNVASKFENTWNFPLCLGALDGRHIPFRAKGAEGKLYYNYKGFHSIALLALVDAEYNFLYFDVESNGPANAGRVYKSSSLCGAIEYDLVDLPASSAALPGISKEVPYVIVTDDAFKLTNRTMKRYGHRTSDANKVFNYRLSRVMRVAENAIGLLTHKFKVLTSTLDLGVAKVRAVTTAACVLYNYINKEDGRAADRLLDREDVTKLELIGGEWRRGLQLVELQPVGNRSAMDPMDVRDSFTEYFNGQGAVPWQQAAIHKFNV